MTRLSVWTLAAISVFAAACSKQATGPASSDRVACADLKFPSTSDLGQQQANLERLLSDLARAQSVDLRNEGIRLAADEATFFNAIGVQAVDAATNSVRADLAQLGQTCGSEGLG